MTNENETAVITGASSGIGLGLTKVLLDKGYRVVANSRRIITSGVLAASSNLLLIDGDIGLADTGKRLIEAAVGRFGSVDLLVNNAGVFIPKAFTEYTTEEFQQRMSTNLGGLPQCIAAGREADGPPAIRSHREYLDDPG